MKKVNKLSLEELNRVDVETFKSTPKVPLYLVLDNIRSGLNVGSLFRTSDAFLIQSVLLCGITARPPHKEILKTAIGAQHAVDWSYFENTELALQKLKNENVNLIGIEQTDSSIMLQDFKVDSSLKYAIILGNEVKGISDDVIDMIDYFIEIPQYGTKHSLNVSVCGGIILHHFSQLHLGQ